MSELPKIKKKVAAFLANEEGKISKEKLVKMGVLAGITSATVGILSSQVLADHSNYLTPYTHSNNIQIKDDGSGFYGEHSHSAGGDIHSNHNSHGSHGSHNSW